MQTNILFARKTIKLEVGSRSQSATITLPTGMCLGAYIVPIKNENPEQVLDVSVQNSQSGDVITATDFRDYFHKGGGYLQGVKQLNYPTDNQQFQINVNADENISQIIKFQMIFIIKIGSSAAMGCSDNQECGCKNHY